MHNTAKENWKTHGKQAYCKIKEICTKTWQKANCVVQEVHHETGFFLQAVLSTLQCGST